MIGSEDSRPPLELPGEAEPGAYKSVTGDGAPIAARNAIFPILRIDTRDKVHLLGTGFFITTNGLFVTARHVLMDALDSQGRQKYPIGIFQFMDDGSYIPRHILRCVSHQVADVSVGVVSPMRGNKDGELLKNPVLTLTLLLPSLNSRIVTFAYPKHSNVISGGGGQVLRFAPTFYDGHLLEHLPNGRDAVLLPGPCYRTSIMMHGGASGGPVFSSNGWVFGVNSTGFDGADVSFVSRISEIFGLVLDGICIDGQPARRTRLVELARAGHIVVEPQVSLAALRSDYPKLSTYTE